METFDEGRGVLLNFLTQGANSKTKHENGQAWSYKLGEGAGMTLI